MKRKLLLAVLCVVGALGFTAQAQTWSNSDLANGKYIFKNIGSGRYLGPGNSWGTQASLIEASHFNTLAKISDGVYTIESQVENKGGHYLGADLFMDKGNAANVTIQDNGEGVFTMSIGGGYLGYDGTTTVLKNGLTDPTNANAQWQIVSYDDYLSTATEENPVDASYRILCQNFDRNHRSAGAWTMVASNQNLCGGTDANKCAESWQAAFTLSQTVTLPNGYYKVRAQAACWEYTVTGADYPVVYAGNVTVPFKQMTDDSGGMDGFSGRFANGEYYTDWSDMVTVTSKSLTVGVKGTRTNTWCIWDNIQLMYYGPLDLSSYQQGLDEAIVAAKAVSGEMSSSVAAKLATAISTYDGKTYETEEEYVAAIDAVTAATTAAKKSINSYKIIATGIIPDNSLEGWTCENTNTFHINTWSVEGNSDGSNMKTPFIENWVAKGSYLGAGKVYYKLEGLEPGEVYYAQALVRSYNEASDDAPNGPNFFINDVVTSLSEAGTTFTYNNMSGIYATLGGGATVGADGTLTLGVEIASDRNYNWVAFKNVSIQPMAKAFDAAVAKVEALNGKIPAAAYEAANAVVANYQGENYPTTMEDFETAIAAIESAATAATQCVEPYAMSKTLLEEGASLAVAYPNMNTPIQQATLSLETKSTVDKINEFNETLTNAINIFSAWLEIKAYADKNVTVGTDNTGAQTSLSNAIEEQEARVQAVNEVSESGLATVNDAISTLKRALTTYVGVANPVGDGAQFDMTFLMTNPDLTGLATWAPADGWASEESDGNSQVMVNDSKTDGDYSYFYEYWSNPAKASGNFALYNTVRLPAGTYAMSCYAFAENQYASSTVDGVYFYANDTQGSCVTATVLTEQTLEFNNSEEQDVKIGLKTLTGNTRNWMGIGYVKLYKVPANTTAYAINVSATNANVTVTVAGEDATECLPLETVTLGITPNADYYVKNVTVTYDGGTCDVANPSENTYTFQMPKANVNVTVETAAKDVVEMVISDAKWATFIAPFDVTIPDGVTAYTVNAPETGSNTLNLTPWETTIPANTPVVLFSKNTVNQSMKGIANATEKTYTEGLLTGVYKNTKAPDGSYVLQKQDNVVAFYKVEATADITVPANRAYLNAPANGANVRGFFFPEAGEATAIAGIEALTSGNYDGIYTAGGVKVNSLQKGLNIVVKDGKSYKIFVK